MRRRRWLHLLGFFLIGIGLVWIVTTGLVYSSTAGPADAIPGEREFWGYDFRAYFNAAVRLQDEGSLYAVETTTGPFRPGPFGLYMYAPPLGIGFLAATSAGLADGVWAWWFIHVAALMAACALLPVRPQVRLFTFGIALFSFAIVKDMALGNVSVLLLLPAVIAWRWLDRPLGAIAQAIAISIRPTLGILLVWQLLRRQWRAIAWTVGAGLTLILLTLPFVGASGYVDYLAVLSNMTDVTGVLYNYDLGSLGRSLSGDETVGTAALLLGYTIAIVAMLLSLRRDREVGFIVTLTGSLLLSPLLWDHYLSMLLLPAAFLAERGRPWAVLLPLLAWVPAIVESWTFLYPLIVVAATLLPLAARDPQTAPDPGLHAIGSPGAPGRGVVT